MFHKVRLFTPTVWLVVCATMAARFTFFMVWPYLAVFLHEDHALNPWQIGAFLTTAGAIGACAGFYVGYLSDRFGRRRVILSGLIVSMTSLSLLAISGNLLIIMAAMTAQSIARGAIETPGKALMTDVLDDREAKDLALHARYYALNIGAAFGPVVGAYWGLTGHKLTFLLVASVMALYFVVAVLVFFRLDPAPVSSKPASSFSFFDVLQVLRSDRVFLIFVLAMALGGVGYAQIDSGLVQYFTLSGEIDVRAFFPYVVLLNGMTVLVFQFPLLALMRRVAPFLRAMIGILLLSLSFAMLAIVPITSKALILLSIFVLSLGEVILFPTAQVLIDRLAPDEMKGSYFGAAAMAGFGFVAGPLVGGWLLHLGGGACLWWGMAILCGVVALLYRGAERLRPSKTA